MKHVAPLLAAILFASPAHSECRQALALGLDVSGSVDMQEYRLQVNGLIEALETPGVRNALLVNPQAPVELLIYEWSGPDDQYILQDWTPIRSRLDIEILQNLLRVTKRRATQSGTALGVAMQTGRAALKRKPECWKHTLDISGDGKNNIGPAPEILRDQLAKDGITVNALVIGADSPDLGALTRTEIGELATYYATKVITGPEAFVQTALGYEEYARSMARKLEKELQGFATSGLSHPAKTFQ